MGHSFHRVTVEMSEGGPDTQLETGKRALCLF